MSLRGAQRRGNLRIMTPVQKSILFITDPLSGFDPQAETTSFLMKEGERRGYAVWQATVPQLYYDRGEPAARAQELGVRHLDGRFAFEVKRQAAVPLASFRLIFLRKDPPVDQAYLYHLQLLSLLEDVPEVMLVNRPSGILVANEKLLPLALPEISPETAVTCDPDIFSQFLARHGDIILKPLNLSGGRGIYRCRS